MSEVERKNKKDKKEKKEKKEKKDKKDESLHESPGDEVKLDKKEKKRKHREENIPEPASEETLVIESDVVIDKDENSESERERKRLRKEAKKAKKLAAKSAESGSNAVSKVSVGNLPKSKLSAEEVLKFRKDLGIQVYPEEDSERYKPFTTFNDLTPIISSTCSYVQDYIIKKQFKAPSAIQAQCWPPLLEGRDVIGIAMTGSGKTLAFLIPGIIKLITQSKVRNGQMIMDNGKPKPSPSMLVMAPTRELAMQSYQVVEDLGGMKGICIFGGVSKDTQKAGLRSGVEIVIATPGRLVDLIDERVLTLENAIYVVLDEADRMLDEGFEPAIRKILNACPPKTSTTTQLLRQTVMFSATWPEEIRKLADSFMNGNSVRVCIGSEELAANHRVTQIVECVENSYQVKDRKLIELLEKYHKSRTNRCLIFVLYKKEAVQVEQVLKRKGYKVTSIHGSNSQVDRFKALEEFKSGSTPLLIATDVAGRGLDIPQVEYVINYSFPLTVEDYVHRIGRTGRGGATGISHTFFTDFDKALAGALVGVLQEAGQQVPPEIYKYPMLTKKKTSQLYGDFGPKKDLVGKTASKITFDE